MIFTALSPNTQKDDYSLAVKTLLKPSNYLEGEYTRKLGQWFRGYFGLKYVAGYESARTALYFVLKDLGIKEGDEVLLQSFTCVAASNPIKWIGARPVFVDIDLHDFNMDISDLENKITSKSKAVVVQHTFAYPARMREIVNIAREKNLFVIEDCAHSIGGEFEGKKLGTIGDAGIFSLGRDKAISASFGGIVISSRKKLGMKLEEGVSFLNFPDKKWVRKQILYTVVAYLTRRYYDSFKIGRLIHYLATKISLINKATSSEEKRKSTMPPHAKSRIPNAFAKIALHQLEKLDKINTRRQELMNIYNERIEKIRGRNIVLPEWKRIRHFYPLRYPLRVKNREALLAYAESRGVLLGDWYNTPVAPKEVDLLKAGYKRGSCIACEEICEDIINLPINLNISKEDALKIVAILKDFYEK